MQLLAKLKIKGLLYRRIRILRMNSITTTIIITIGEKCHREK